MTNALDDFLAEAETMTSVPDFSSEPLTSEEEQELQEIALQNILSQQREVQELPQAQAEQVVVEETRSEEDIVEVPNYTNVREETLRFSGAEWFQKVQEQIVILAGVGGIGSNMAMILAKLNPEALYLFDDDVVGIENLAGQFYSMEDIGKPKVNALANNINKFTNYSKVFACNRRYTEYEEIYSDVMICGFDNMTARKHYYKAWKEYVVMQKPENERKNCLFIDGRLTAEEFQILCMAGDDEYYMQQYETRFLFNSWEAESTVCSFKQTGYLADMIGAFMVNLLVNFCANLVNPTRNMPLPFFTKYNANVMYLNKEV